MIHDVARSAGVSRLTVSRP
ncbi:LacI family DNA-binding transcriptional regulator [Streptomyces sp. NBC_01511]